MMRAMAVVCFVFVLLLGFQAPSVAQSSPAVMTERIEALERQLRLLQRRTSTGAAAVVADSSETSVSDRRLLADISARLGTLDRQIRQLNGRLEEYEYRQNQLSEALDELRTQMAVQREQQLAAASSAADAPAAAPTLATPPQNGAADGEQLEQLPTAPVTEPALQVQLPEGSVAERYSYAFAFVRSNELDNGRVAMEQFLAEHGDDPQAANAKFWLGRIHMQQGRNAEAAQLFLNLIEDHPNHNRRADSLVDLADVLISLGAAEDACNALAEFRRIEDSASERLRTKARRVSDRARCNVF